MRVLRLTMTLLCFIMIALSGISWYRGAVVVEYTDRQAVAIHDMGHRMYYVEVCKGFFLSSARSVGSVGSSLQLLGDMTRAVQVECALEWHAGS
jgi:hypothetical protein